MNFANIEEVYGKNFISGKKASEKRRKKNIPLETNEMETELITKHDMAEFTRRNTPSSRISRVNMDPFDKDENMNRYIYNMNGNIAGNNISNEDVVPISPFNHSYSMYHDMINDPEYRDFLVYKKMRKNTNDLYEPFINSMDVNSDEFDNLLLYIFTGIFILIMFDNVFKLGLNY